jgi:hypothetical protein
VAHGPYNGIFFLRDFLHGPAMIRACFVHPRSARYFLRPMLGQHASNGVAKS